ncbi:hypothetical protein L6164_005115 [Bauhinia variegata]|uniref:Uncharacterized protein n=1 Tax=Bauhinia variegata TaxID=167791 RepID=A0ACB9PQR8_BAUVA|nr:hypothetical protein L6164_005115 [Bauhinia variegata]
MRLLRWKPQMPSAPQPFVGSEMAEVLSVEPLSNRVEVTLKTPIATSGQKTDNNDLSNLHVGDVTSGTIRLIETYGLFIAIDNTNLVGLCHVSEISDDHIDNIQTKYRAGERVNARILKVDGERHRISLGMKSSYLVDQHALEKRLEQGSEEPAADGMKPISLMNSSLLGAQNMDTEGENDEHSILSQAEARVFIPPLDDFDHVVGHDINSQNQEQANEDTIHEKQKRRAKKKAKEEREKEIRAAEERLLEQDVPRTADEFEKLVRSSPNSSFIWIKYMNFMISLADVEKARSIAERYQLIHYCFIHVIYCLLTSILLFLSFSEFGCLITLNA